MDPYLTRIPFWRVWAGHVAPAREMLAQFIRRVDDILVTHPHFDHLMDVQEIAIRSKARVAASPNGCRLLEILGVPAAQVRELQAGDVLKLGPFRVEVRAAQHGSAPGYGAGKLKPGLHPPLHARDYWMDMDFSFLLHVAGLRILVEPGEYWQDAARADVLFISPARSRKYYEKVLQRVRPWLVIPLHWDNLFRPLSAPLQPFYGLPRLSLPPLRHINLVAFTHMVAEIIPTARAYVPDLHQQFRLTTSDIFGVIAH